MWLRSQRDREPAACARTKDDQPPLVWLIVQRGEAERVSSASPQPDLADKASTHAGRARSSGSAHVRHEVLAPRRVSPRYTAPEIGWVGCSQDWAARTVPTRLCAGPALGAGCWSCRSIKYSLILAGTVVSRYSGCRDARASSVECSQASGPTGGNTPHSSTTPRFAVRSSEQRPASGYALLESEAAVEMSRPCAVSAQMMATSMAMMMTPQTG